VWFFFIFSCRIVFSIHWLFRNYGDDARLPIAASPIHRLLLLLSKIWGAETRPADYPYALIEAWLTGIHSPAAHSHFHMGYNACAWHDIRSGLFTFNGFFSKIALNTFWAVRCSGNCLESMLDYSYGVWCAPIQVWKPLDFWKQIRKGARRNYSFCGRGVNWGILNNGREPERPRHILPLT